MVDENYEIYNMIEGFILSDNNCDNASDIYFNRYSEKPQFNKPLKYQKNQTFRYNSRQRKTIKLIMFS